MGRVCVCVCVTKICDQDFVDNCSTRVKELTRQNMGDPDPLGSSFSNSLVQIN